jgi:hypothetical protein
MTLGESGTRVPVRILALAVAVLLIAGLVGAAVIGRDRPAARVAATKPRSAASSTTSTTTAPPSPAAQARLDALVTELEGFVERTRGLTFTSRVKVTLLDDAAFRRQLMGGEQTDKTAVDKAAKVLRALGLIGQDVDLAKAETDLLGGSVAGYYDRKAKELFVRGADPTPYVREILVHELTHALQHQHFNIDRSDLAEGNDEKAQSFTAVIEGDAVRVQRLYRSQLSAADRRRADGEENKLGGGVPKTVPSALIELLQFPYIVGPAFIQAIMAKGGQAALDAAFTTPPTTSEQLIAPAKYSAGEGEAVVPEPSAGGTVIDRGDLGELGLLLVLEKDVAQGDAIRAGAGWGGDKYVAWDQGAQTCVRDRMVMDTPKDRSEAIEALRRWASKHAGVKIDTSPTGGPTGAFEFTSCG